jgi:TM2 domain-containing membrane protein YozV
MPIKTVCPKCHYVNMVDDQWLNSQVHCPTCSAPYLAWPSETVDDSGAPVGNAPPPLPIPSARPVRQAAKSDSEKFCQECGEAIRAKAVVCPRCGVRQAGSMREADEDSERAIAVRNAASNKVAAGICGILLGALGIHKFILGLTTPGIIMVLVSVLTCGFGAPVMHIIGFIEGIIYLTKSDEDFYQLYFVERRGWF